MHINNKKKVKNVVNLADELKIYFTALLTNNFAFYEGSVVNVFNCDTIFLMLLAADLLISIIIAARIKLLAIKKVWRQKVIKNSQHTQHKAI